MRLYTANPVPVNAQDLPQFISQELQRIEAALAQKSKAPAKVSSSTVSIRFFVSGPVSSILPAADYLMTPLGPNRLRKSGSLG